MNLKVAIVGLGSIGNRHLEVLESMCVETYVVSRSQTKKQENYFKTISSLLNSTKIDIVVICTESSDHLRVLKELEDQKFAGKVLVEKPLFSENENISFENRSNIFVAYNLRFSSGLMKLKEILKKERVLQVVSYVGQYLPTWRPGTDYRESYSSKLSKGGGVLRDLSHELDFLIWLFGSPESLYAIGGKASSLEIDTDDFQSILFKTKQVSSIQVSLNYLDRITQRRLTVICDSHTYQYDFISNTLFKDLEKVQIEENKTYERQWESLLWGKNQECLCNFEQGLSVMKFIEKIELSEKEQRVVMFEN